MKIKIEKSGGLAGISSSHEMDADELPSSLEELVGELLNSTKSPLKMTIKKPTGAADCLNYKITIGNGKLGRVIECNELAMDSSMKSLVSYIQKNSEKK